MIIERLIIITLPETNIAPKNGWLEYYFPIGKAYFQGRTVSFREGTVGVFFQGQTGFTSSFFFLEFPTGDPVRAKWKLRS